MTEPAGLADSAPTPDHDPTHDPKRARRTVAVLAFVQALSMTGAGIVMLVTGLAGAYLAEDDRLGIKRERLDELLGSAESEAGAAEVQVDAFLSANDAVKTAYPDAEGYRPGSIL